MKAGIHVMEARTECMRLCILVLYFSIAATTHFTQCEARRARQLFKFEGHKPHKSSTMKPTKVVKHIDAALDLWNALSYTVSSPFTLPPFDSLPPSNALPYGVSSPFSIAPFASLAPLPLPENTPPFCEYPPFTPQPPSSILPTPIFYTPPPPPSPTFPIQNPPPTPSAILPSPPEYTPIPNPPEYVPSPPTYVPTPPEYVPSPPAYVPNPPEYVPTPPTYVPIPPESVPSTPTYVPNPPEYGPSPPSIVPSPPKYVPSPGGFVPSPPVFQPPVVYPPPSVPSSPHKGPGLALWCVAKPSVPDPIIQEAMNYACGSGADCGSIQPNGSCYQPDTLFAHASYAFNSYWQRTKVAGGTCDFGGTAMLVTVDPSFDGCHFIYY